MITITGGKLERRGDGYHSTEALSQSTATAAQSLSLTTDVTFLGMGTATGVNIYSLADGTEGQEKYILATATGEARVGLTGTATGAFVLTDADDLIAVRFIGGKWRILQSTATLASAT